MVAVVDLGCVADAGHVLQYGVTRVDASSNNVLYCLCSQ